LFVCCQIFGNEKKHLANYLIKKISGLRVEVRVDPSMASVSALGRVLESDAKLVSYGYLWLG